MRTCRGEMGYYVEVWSTDFALKGNKDELVPILKKEFGYQNTNPIHEFELAEILEDLGWEMEVWGPDPTKVSLCYYGKFGDEVDGVIAIIAPYVKDRSMLYMSGEEYDDLSRYVYENGEVREEFPQLIWPS